MINGLLFDLDGTIIDSELHYDNLNIELLSNYGKKYEPLKEKPLLMGLPNIAYATDIVKRHNLLMTPEEFSELRREKIKQAYREKVKYILGFETFFQKLIKHFNCNKAIVTGCNKENFDLVDARLNLTKLFDGHIIRTDDVGKHKPDPAPFIYAAKKIGVDCKNCLVFEDAPSGIVSGYRAGAKVVALTTTLDKKSLIKHTLEIDPTIEINSLLFINKFNDSSLKKIISYTKKNTEYYSSIAASSNQSFNPFWTSFSFPKTLSILLCVNSII
ncbi:MAG: HAD-IA family hydrolase [Candidatus Woesearchaeota archaeon]|jgi:pseudouridine-5'-monophosphatase